MEKVASTDGTQIAYDKQGTGPAVILVDGALCYRSFGPMPGLAQLLAPHCTVYTYDRRGRGESGDTRPYAVEREVEDLEALIDNAGGSANLCGLSSGAALALETAIKLGDTVQKLGMYEAPYAANEAAQPEWSEYDSTLAKLVAEDRRGDAVVLFMTVVGTPNEMVEPSGEIAQPTLWSRSFVGTSPSTDTAQTLVLTEPHSFHSAVEG